MPFIRTAQTSTVPPSGTYAPNPRTAADRVSGKAGLDVTKIHTAVHHYYSQGLATSTQRSYLTGQKRYLQFCNEAHKPPLPTSEDTLLIFVSYLAQQGLTHQSIKVYHSAVRNLHVSMGLQEEFSKQLIPRLELVLKGIKTDKARDAPPASRLPVTI